MGSKVMRLDKTLCISCLKLGENHADDDDDDEL